MIRIKTKPPIPLLRGLGFSPGTVVGMESVKDSAMLSRLQQDIFTQSMVVGATRGGFATPAVGEAAVAALLQSATAAPGAGGAMPVDEPPLAEDAALARKCDCVADKLSEFVAEQQGVPMGGAQRNQALLACYSDPDMVMAAMKDLGIAVGGFMGGCEVWYKRPVVWAIGGAAALGLVALAWPKKRTA